MKEIQGVHTAEGGGELTDELRQQVIQETLYRKPKPEQPQIPQSAPTTSESRSTPEGGGQSLKSVLEECLTRRTSQAEKEDETTKQMRESVLGDEEVGRVAGLLGRML